MKVNNAKVCLDCEELFEQWMQSCPKCASKDYWYLGVWLGGNKPNVKQWKEARNENVRISD